MLYYGFCEFYRTALNLKQCDPTKHQHRFLRIQLFICERRMQASLVAQWWRVSLSMQETQVRSLTWEDPTCSGATKSMHHNYWGCEGRLLKTVLLEPVLCHKRREEHQKRAQWETHTMQLESSPCVCACVCARVRVRLVASDSCYPKDCSLPDSSVHGILQARTCHN